MRDSVLEILERNSLTHTAYHLGWTLTWRDDGLVDLVRGEVRHTAVERQKAHSLMIPPV